MFAFSWRGVHTVSLIEAACEREARRQWESLILIPSSKGMCLIFVSKNNVSIFFYKEF